MGSRWLLPAAVVLVASCASGGGPRDTETSPDPLLEAMRPHRTAPNVPVTGELGSEGNPIRVLMPEGEREYLHRLRCNDGTAPAFERQGSFGIGPYGKILDGYTVECRDGRKAQVFMDMYHCVEEIRPVPGFEIVPEIGTRNRPGCD